MKNIRLKLVIDILAFIAFLGLISSGILMHFLLPAGSGRWLSVWGMNRHAWGEIHFYIASTFFTILVLHLILHWRFFFSLVKNPAGAILPWRVILSLTGLIAIISLVSIPLLAPVQQIEAESPAHQHGHGQVQPR